MSLRLLSVLCYITVFFFFKEILLYLKNLLLNYFFKIFLKVIKSTQEENIYSFHRNKDQKNGVDNCPKLHFLKENM